MSLRRMSMYLMVVRMAVSNVARKARRVRCWWGKCRRIRHHEFEGSKYDGNIKNDDDYLGWGERKSKKESRSDDDAEPCGSASASNGLALCIDIIHTMSYSLSIVLTASNLIDIVLLTSYCTTPRHCSCHSESCANQARKLATIPAVFYSLSSSLPVPSLTTRDCVVYNFLVSLSLWELC